jgi:hypothetical protein
MGEIDAKFGSHLQLMTAWETIWGTPVTVDTEIGLCSSYTVNWADEQNFFQGTGQSASYVNWVDRQNRDFELVLHPQGAFAFAAMLKNDLTGIAGQNVNGVDAESTLYKFKYVDPTTGLIYASPDSFSLDAALIQAGTDSLHRYTSVFCRSGTIEIPSTAVWNLTVTCGASDGNIVAAERETYVQPQLTPFLGSKTCITIDGTNAVNLESITINLDGAIRDAFTFCNNGSQNDAHREDFYHGITADLSLIMVSHDFLDSYEKFENIGDVIITYDDSLSAEKRMLKIWLRNCKITSKAEAYTVDNAIVMDDLTVQPTGDGVNDPIEIWYSTKTSGGFSGW